MGSLTDKKGVIHTRGGDGQYKPKQGWFGPEKDTDWLGKPKVERDFFGNPKVERDWLGRPVRSKDGSILYKHKGSGSSSSMEDDAIGCLITIGLTIIVMATVAVLLWVIFPFFVMIQQGLSTYPLAVGVGWISLIWMTIAKGWLKPIWTAFKNIVLAYWHSTVKMWDWTWSKI